MARARPRAARSGRLGRPRLSPRGSSCASSASRRSCRRRHAPRPRIAKSFALLAFLRRARAPRRPARSCSPRCSTAAPTTRRAPTFARPPPAARGPARRRAARLRRGGVALDGSVGVGRLRPPRDAARRGRPAAGRGAPRRNARALAITERGEYLAGSRPRGSRSDASTSAAGGRRAARTRRSSRSPRVATPRRAARRATLARPLPRGGPAARMRIANAIGDEDRVIAAYRHCERVLGELGTTPSSTTRRLLETLRR